MRCGEKIKMRKTSHSDHGLVLRTVEPSGYLTWLIVTREKREFGAGDRAVLSALAPHVSIALRSYATIDRERTRAGISVEAVRRLNFGWVTLDTRGHVVDMDMMAEQLLQRSYPQTHPKRETAPPLVIS